jgi:TDG/mug DNA glycosylase family protein
MINPPKLPDVLAPGLRVVFCGTAAGTQSALKQAYYAGPGNRFWSVLDEIDLTETKIEAASYREILRYGIGLTDVCKAHSGMDNDLPTDAFAPDKLKARIAEVNPQVIAFNGKKAAQVALGLSSTRDAEFGPHEQPFGGAVVWVLPSTSRAANGHWDVAHWRALANSLPPWRGTPS